LFPQLRTKLDGGNVGFARLNCASSTLGAMFRGGSRPMLNVSGISTERSALRTAVKYSSGFMPEQVPWALHSWLMRLTSGIRFRYAGAFGGAGMPTQFSG